MKQGEEREGENVCARARGVCVSLVAAAVPSAADRFIEWHVPIQSNVVLYFSTFRRERLVARAKSSAAGSLAGQPLLSSSSPLPLPLVFFVLLVLLAPRDRGYRSSAVVRCGVLPLWTFLDDSCGEFWQERGRGEGQGGRGSRERERELRSCH